MSYRRLVHALLQNEPYVGPVFHAMQGPPERHQCFLPALKAAAVGRPTSLSILEIGSWAGASTLSWGRALEQLGFKGRITCIDPWRPYFDLQKDPEFHYRKMNDAAASGLIYRLFRHNIQCAGFDEIVETKIGTSTEILPQLPDGAFHLIYIDGSHTFPDVVHDIRHAKRLTAVGGIICGDDLELEAKAVDLEELRNALKTGADYIFSQSGGGFYHPGVSAAVAQEFNAVTMCNGFWATIRHDSGWSPAVLDMTDARIPEHISSAVPKYEGEIPGYRLVSDGSRYYAVSNAPEVRSQIEELLGHNDLPPLLFGAATLSEARTKAQRPVQSGAVDPTPPTILEEYRGFNLVSHGRKIVGVRQSLGEVNVSAECKELERSYGPRDLIIGDSADGVKTRIDLIWVSDQPVAALTADLANAISGIQKASAETDHLIREFHAELSGARWRTGGNNQEPTIEECYRGFQVVRFMRKIYASQGDVQSLLAQSPVPEALPGQQSLIVGESIDTVRARIDAFFAEETAQRLAGSLESICGRNLLNSEEHSSTPLTSPSRALPSSTGKAPLLPSHYRRHKSKKISVIYNYFRKETTIFRSLESLDKQTWNLCQRGDIETIIVDDGTEDRFIADNLPPEIIYYWQRKTGYGIARAKNAGARLASGDYLLFLDPDIMLTSSFFVAMLEKFGRFGDRLVQCGYIWDYHFEGCPDPRIEFGVWENPDRPTGRFFQIAGGCLAISRDLFFETPGFDEDLIYGGVEDLLFGYHLSKMPGTAVMFNRQMESRHIPHPPGGAHADPQRSWAVVQDKWPEFYNDYVVRGLR